MTRRSTGKGSAAGGDAAALRRRAERRLGEQKPKPPADGDPRRLVHDLEVHQIELEMQNEELRSSRQEAETAAAKYTGLYEFAPMAYATLATDGAIRAINLAGATLLGLPRAQLVGLRLGHFVSPEDRGAYAAFLDEVLEHGEEERSAVERALRNGEKRYHARLTATFLHAAVPEILLALEDVSERRRHEGERAELLRAAEEARARAEEANRAKDSFLATLSHELRNPLAPI